jgi:hypothetical protein
MVVRIIDMKFPMKAVVFALVSFAAVAGCSSSDAQTGQSPGDASTSADPDSSPPSDDASADAASDAARDAGHPDAGACPPCAAHYNCVTTPGGQQVGISATKNADGSCEFGGAKLACGGKGEDKSGKPLVWEAGNNVGPSGGPGLYVKFDTLQLNCE